MIAFCRPLTAMKNEHCTVLGQQRNGYSELFGIYKHLKHHNTQIPESEMYTIRFVFDKQIRVIRYMLQ